jgi:hypothetical protein
MFQYLEKFNLHSFEITHFLHHSFPITHTVAILLLTVKLLCCCATQYTFKFYLSEAKKKDWSTTLNTVFRYLSFF